MRDAMNEDIEITSKAHLRRLIKGKRPYTHTIVAGIPCTVQITQQSAMDMFEVTKAYEDTHLFLGEWGDGCCFVYGERYDSSGSPTRK